MATTLYCVYIAVLCYAIYIISGGIFLLCALIYFYRRRFDCAEREYVSAKMAVNNCSERKELLSEHLCTIIQQNETRKAHKLSQLMRELNIPDDNPVISQ